MTKIAMKNIVLNKTIILTVCIIGLLLIADFRLQFFQVKPNFNTALQYEYNYKHSFGTYTKINVAQHTNDSHKYEVKLRNKNLYPLQKGISSSLAINPDRPVSFTWLKVSKREIHLIGFLTEPNVQGLNVINELGESLAVTYIHYDGSISSTPIASDKPLFWYVPNVTEEMKIIGITEAGTVVYAQIYL